MVSQEESFKPNSLKMSKMVSKGIVAEELSGVQKGSKGKGCKNSKAKSSQNKQKQKSKEVIS